MTSCILNVENSEKVDRAAARLRGCRRLGLQAYTGSQGRLSAGMRVSETGRSRTLFAPEVRSRTPGPIHSARD